VRVWKKEALLTKTKVVSTGTTRSRHPLMSDNYNARPATDRIPGQLRRVALLSDN
jgi:hypothetical protein